MKVLAFAATNSSKSINRTLVNYAANRLLSLKAEAEVEYIDINDYEMPIYSIDREQSEGVHPLALKFYEKIGAADGLLISYAEYNGSVTSAWKNIFDWMSRIDMKVWQNKPTVILAATPGGRAGAGVLGGVEMAAPYFGMDLKGTYGVGKWADAWDGSTLVKPIDLDGVDAAVKGLIA